MSENVKLVVVGSDTLVGLVSDMDTNEITLTHPLSIISVPDSDNTLKITAPVWMLATSKRVIKFQYSKITLILDPSLEVLNSYLSILNESIKKQQSNSEVKETPNVV